MAYFVENQNLYLFYTVLYSGTTSVLLIDDMSSRLNDLMWSFQGHFQGHCERMTPLAISVKRAISDGSSLMVPNQGLLG